MNAQKNPVKPRPDPDELEGLVDVSEDLDVESAPIPKQIVVPEPGSTAAPASPGPRPKPR